jgi:hypothetical protein
VRTLRKKTVDQAGNVPPHIVELRKARAVATRAAERIGATGRLKVLACDCTWSHFSREFFPPHYEVNETVQQWNARVDWDAYPRAWIDRSIRPFLRELRLRSAWLGIDVEEVLRCEDACPDKRLREIRRYTADFARRLYATLDDERRQLDLEEELVRTFAEDAAGRERYHDAFEVFAGRFERMALTGGTSSRDLREPGTKETTKAPEDNARQKPTPTASRVTERSDQDDTIGGLHEELITLRSFFSGFKLNGTKWISLMECEAKPVWSAERCAGLHRVGDLLKIVQRESPELHARYAAAVYHAS